MVECPLIEIVRTSDDPIDCAGYEWAIVTSPNGADEVARRARNLPKVAAVGPGTAETLRAARDRAGVRRDASRRPRCWSRSSRKPEGRVIYLAAENSRRGPIDALEADFVPLYATVLLQPEPPAGDVVVLASGSAARAYAWIGGAAPAVSIGPETTQGRGLGRAGGRGRGDDARPRRARRGRRGVRRGGARPCTSTITFLTDFGLQDDFVGVCRGVMKADRPRRAASSTSRHGIAPQAVTAGRARARPLAPLPAAGGPPRRRRPRRRERPPRRSRSRPARAASSSDPTTACSCSRPTARGSRRRAA